MGDFCQRVVVAFAGVLWSISPLLFGVAIAYAICGSLLTIVLGKRLVRLNYDQLDKEANFRADLIHVRENAESVALLHREGRLTARLLRHLQDLVANFERIIMVNRNLGFFTNGYNWLIQIIPALIVAPLFIRGSVEFGVITQSAMAFTMLLGAFSLIITQFQSISSFTAVIARLGSLTDSLEKSQSIPVSDIQVTREGKFLIYDGLTLRLPRDGRIVIDKLSITIPTGTRVLITGSNETGKVALFRATAGIWRVGEGHIIRPQHRQLLFLPEQPYLPPGTLRELLLRTGQEHETKDEQILATLRALDIERVVTLAGGLDVEKNWNDILSLGEQQLLAFARLLLAAPLFAFLERPGTALNQGQIDRILKMLSDKAITYLTLGETDDQIYYDYDAVLELENDSGWKWNTLVTEPPKPESLKSSAIEFEEDKKNGNIRYTQVTLLSPGNSNPLIKELSQLVPRGIRLLIRSQNKEAKLVLYKATIGTWNTVKGHILRPRIEQIYLIK